VPLGEGLWRDKRTTGKRVRKIRLEIGDPESYKKSCRKETIKGGQQGAVLTPRHKQVRKSIVESPFKFGPNIRSLKRREKVPCVKYRVGGNGEKPHLLFPTAISGTGYRS